MKSSEELLNTESPAEPAPAVGPGLRLAQARGQRGLSVDQVSRETNLSPRYVQALEADDYDALPGAAFIRGYIRRYAQMVQLPGDELVAAFDAAWSHRSPAPVATAAAAVRGAGKATPLGQAAGDLLAVSGSRVSFGRLLSWGSLILLILLLLGSLFWSSGSDNAGMDTTDPVALDINAANEAAAQAEAEAAQAQAEAQAPAPDAAAGTAEAAGQTPVAPAEATPSAEPATQPQAPVGVMPAPAAPVQPTAAPAPAAPGAQPAAPAASSAPVAAVINRAPAPGSQPAPTAKPATTTIPVTTLPAEPVRPPSAPAPATVIPAGPAPVASNGPRIDSLSFSFSGKSWISVRDATGQELVYGLKAPGQTVTVTGQAPFSINIGNVNVTTLSRNGKPVNLKPYTRGEIASFRLMR